jgi:hypothetical protein
MYACFHALLKNANLASTVMQQRAILAAVEIVLGSQVEG